MLIGRNSKYLLKKTRSKAKMYEYGIPPELHIEVESNANELLVIAISAIGNISAQILNEENPYRRIPEEKKQELEFASHYFDAFFQSSLEPNYDQYYLLLGAIAYYYCDYIGSSRVMANMIDTHEFDISCNGIDTILVSMLCDNLDLNFLSRIHQNSPYQGYLSKIVDVYHSFFYTHKSPDISFVKEFRSVIYAHGTPRELLLADAL